MPKTLEEYQDELPQLKSLTEEAYQYFSPNYQRFRTFQDKAFRSTISTTDATALNNSSRPIIEFNVLNAPIDRLCGEFSKQEPSIEVKADDLSKVHPETERVVSGHLRHILDEAKNRNVQYNAYRNQLSGGYSVYKVSTEYANEMSFDQVIKFDNVYDETLCGFDPMAREVTKRDANYCYELYPMTLEAFKAEYPNSDTSKIKFINYPDKRLNWSYTDRGKKVLMVCDFYKRKKVRVTIVELATGEIMTKKQYRKFLEDWQAEGRIEQPPIIKKSRRTTITKFCRYRLTENEIVAYDETEFKYPPLVFVDCNSYYSRRCIGGSSVDANEAGFGSHTSNVEQFTKPYHYNAIGIQNLINLSGQTIANDIENLIQHKFMIAIESLPSDEASLQPIRNPQIPGNILYYSRDPENPDMQNPAPIPVQRMPLPAEIVNTFNSGMQMLQNILGSYDASLGINNNQLSGIAVVEAATQSNAAAMPAVVNNILALNQVAIIITDLIPKYYITPRTIPVLNAEGQRDYVRINDKNAADSIDLNYDSNVLKVKVEAGVSFAIAKNRALQQIIFGMQASPAFADFINSVGLEVFLDNMEFRGVDILKEEAKKYMQQKQQEEQNKPDLEAIQAQAIQAESQARQMEAQTGAQRVQLEAQKLQEKSKQDELDNVIKIYQIQEDKREDETERLNILIKAAQESQEVQANIENTMRRAEAEERKSETESQIELGKLAMQQEQQQHNQSIDLLKLANEVAKTTSAQE